MTPRPAALRRLWTDEGGSMTVELVLVFPLLAWVLLASVTFFEGFQARANAVKATYTLADILSREATEPITPVFLDNLDELYAALIADDVPLRLRVTVFRYDDAADAYRVVWSQVRGTGPTLTDQNLAQIRAAAIPNMTDGEVGILVETTSRHRPELSLGLDPFELENLMIIRPRFAPTLCWSASDTGPWTAANEVC